MKVDMSLNKETKLNQTNVIKKKKIPKCVPVVRNIHVLFHEQALCRRGQKMKKKFI